MAYTANHLRCLAQRRVFVDDPADATVARYVSPDGAGTFADMRNFQRLLVGCMLYTGTGVLTFKIFGAKTAAGGDAAVIIAHADPTPADAQGDTVWLEITAEQLRALGADFRYVAVEIDNDAAGDVNVFAWEFADPRFPADELTDDYIS